jgi:4-amino-4-deoxy-L-arabinose transferase-like glycosyltransferase
LGWGKRFSSFAAAGWACAYLLLNPLIIWLSGAAYIDLGLMAFCFLACYAVEVWRRSFEPRWLVLAGVFAGLAAGTKYTALFIVLALTLAVAWFGWQRFGRTALWQCAGRFAVITTLVGAPWYLRNFYYTHNPIFPFLNSTFLVWFGPVRWPVEYKIDLGIVPASGNPFGWFAALWQAPWKLMFQPNSFFIESRLALPFFCLIPLLLGFALVRKQITWLWWLVYAYLVFVYLLAPQMRYLLVVLPLVALMAGQTADWVRLWPQWLRQRQLWLGGLVLLFLLMSWPFAARRLQQSWPAAQLPVTTTQREAYFSTLHPAYGAYQWLNRERGSDYVLYAFGQERLTYFANGIVMGDLFGPAAYRLVLENQQNSAALFQVLRRLGAEYFLVDDNPQLKPMARDEFFATHFKPIFQQGAVVLYQLLP